MTNYQIDYRPDLFISLSSEMIDCIRIIPIVPEQHPGLWTPEALTWFNSWSRVDLGIRSSFCCSIFPQMFFSSTSQDFTFYFVGFVRMQSSVLRQKLVGLTNGVDCVEDLVHEDGIQIVPCCVFYFFAKCFILLPWFFFFYHLLEIRLSLNLFSDMLI